MKKIIYAGDGDAEAASRRHVLRAAGLEVIAVPTSSDAAQLAIERAADLIVVEPGPWGTAARATLATLPSIPVVDLNLDWETLTERLRSNELALAVCALFRLNATEQALRESDARFRSVADAAPVLIWSSGADRMRDYFNQP